MPIREFKNLEILGIGFPKKQPMRLYSTLWNADQWATMGGSVKTNWTLAPFTATYRHFEAKACIKNSKSSSSPYSTSCATSSHAHSVHEWLNQGLDAAYRGKMNWVRKHYMIYNYCNDAPRFPQGLPLECSLPY